MARKEESIENQLLEQLDKQTEPYSAWRTPGVKEGIQRGTGAVRAKADYTKEVKGPKLIDRVESYATDLYTAMGREGNGDPTMLAHHLRTALDKNYEPFREALKIGDVDTAGKLTKDAFENEVGVAQLESIVEKIGNLAPDARIGLGKKAVIKLGGTDYVSAATNPAQLAQSLTRQKALAEQYR